MTLLKKEKLRPHRHERRKMTKTLLEVLGYTSLLLVLVSFFHVFRPISTFDQAINEDDISLAMPLRRIQRLQVTDHSSLLTASKVVRLKKREEMILYGKAHLIDIHIDPKQLKGESGYQGVRGVFCPLKWPDYKHDPSSTPMFRFLVAQSCNRSNTFTYDLREIVEVAKAMDKKTNSQIIHNMKLSGFIFHESRCGSTLVANILTAMEPSEHRIYSESQPPMTAIQACGLDGNGCPPHRAAELLRDVIYLMGRTDDPNEQKLFIKMQSMGSKYIAVMTEAFPDVPWIFVYRDPVQIMMSQLKRKLHNANCVRHWNMGKVTKETYKLLASTGRHKNLIPVEMCALHLSTLCTSAIAAINNSGGMGIGVNYENIVDKLVAEVIPNHFKVVINKERQKGIVEVSGRYSKDPMQSGKRWIKDGEEESKKQLASLEIREASKIFLYPSYNVLSGM